jgi:hypothetical protein
MLPDVISELERRYEAHAGHPWTFAQYREGIGAMVEGLRAYDFGGRDVIIPDMNTALGAEAVQVLSGRASVVVRGLR